MRKNIAVLLVLCMCFSLFSGIGAKRVKADDSPFEVTMLKDGIEIADTRLSSLPTFKEVFSAVQTIASDYPRESSFEVIIRLKSDITIGAERDAIGAVISYGPKLDGYYVYNWTIMSNDGTKKKISGDGVSFIFSNRNSVLFQNIEIDYSGEKYIIGGRLIGVAGYGDIIIRDCVFNSTGLNQSNDIETVYAQNGHRLVIENSIINSNGIAVNTSGRELNIKGSTIAASSSAICAMSHVSAGVISPGSVYIENTDISSDEDIALILERYDECTIKDCDVQAPRHIGISADLNLGGFLTVDNCNITAGGSAVRSRLPSGMMTIKNHSSLSSSRASTVKVESGGVNIEDTWINYTGSSNQAVQFLVNTGGTLSRCNISSNNTGIKVSDGLQTVDISGCTVNTSGTAIKLNMNESGVIRIKNSSSITNTGAGSAIDIAGGTLIIVDGSMVRAQSANGNSISTDSAVPSVIELKDCTLEARNGNSIVLGRSRLKSDGNVELRCGDDLSESTGYSCLSIGDEGSNATEAGDARTGAVDVRSGKLELIPFKDNPSSTDFSAIKVNGDTPVSLNTVLSSNSEYVFGESSYSESDSIVYDRISIKHKEETQDPGTQDPGTQDPGTQNQQTYVSPIYPIISRKEEVEIPEALIPQSDQVNDITLDAGAINNLNLRNTNVLQIKAGKKAGSDSDASMDRAIKLNLAVDLAALPDSIDSLRINTGANLVTVNDISNKLGAGLKIQLAESESRKVQINDGSNLQKTVDNIVNISYKLDGAKNDSVVKITLAAKIPSIKTLGAQEEDGQNEDELSYSRIPDTFAKPVWVSIAEDGTIDKLDSKAVANSKTGEFTLETEISDSGVYGVMDEADADEVILGQLITGGRTDKFMIGVDAGRKKHTVTWLSVESADTYKVYAAKNNGKYKKVAEGSFADALTYTNSKTGSAEWKYKVTAYRQGKKIATSVVVYGVYDKNGTTGSKVTLKVTKKTLKTGATYTLKPTVSGAAKDASIRYYSTNSMIAKVSKKGKITAVNPGVCEIYAYAKDGSYKTIKITVK